MALLAEQGLNITKVAKALNNIAEQRGLQPKVLRPLIKPPLEWSDLFEHIMPESINITLDKAFEKITNIHDQMLEQKLLKPNT